MRLCFKGKREDDAKPTVQLKKKVRIRLPAPRRPCLSSCPKKEREIRRASGEKEDSSFPGGGRSGGSWKKGNHGVLWKWGKS